MGSLRSTTNFLVREIFRPSITLRISTVPLQLKSHHRLLPRSISFSPVRCAAASDCDGKKSPARLAQVKQLLHEATERAQAAGNEPIPKITLDHVTVNFARSGGPGGQNVNKVNTKVDMRFNVKNAYWLSERVREKILQMEKNRINKDGVLVISSTKTRTQKGNIEDALSKLQVLTRDSSHFLSIGMVDLEGQMMLQSVGGCSSMYWSIMNCSLSSILQDIIDAASYVPPPPSEEQVQRISKLAAIGERKRLDNKKAQSQKKAMRRSRDSWD